MSGYEEDDRCPVCRSPDIEGQGFDVIGDCAFQEMVCNECGAGWDDEYRFHGRVNVEDGRALEEEQ